MQYLFIFAQVHDEFRIPELMSVSELNGFCICFPPEFGEQDTSKPFMIIDLEQEEHARILARRCILVKSIYEFYARGSSYEELHASNRCRRSLWDRYMQTSFKFAVTSFNRSISQSHQREVVETFDYMGLLGRIDMKNPKIIFGCFEEHEDTRGLPCKQRTKAGRLLQVYFGRLIEDGSARCLVHKFDVKKRQYFGNTSMEAEISLLMANQTLASPGKFVYDPFIGTGSMAYTVAHFGALVFGSDIDGRQMRGKEKRLGIIRAAEQYGVKDRVIDLCTFDITQNPWRCGSLFDAIVTDPPYGVRAGAKRLGRKRERDTSYQPGPRLDDQPYVPPTKPYELSNLVSDLVLFARYMLRPGGRLVFFLPTVTDEYTEVDIQTMMCDGMHVIANSLQDFGSWGRRLITIRKSTHETYPPPPFGRQLSPDGNVVGARPELTSADGDMSTHVPAHKDFREKYFQGFRIDSRD